MNNDISRIHTDAYVPPPEWGGRTLGIVILVFAVSIAGGYTWYRMTHMDVEPDPIVRINDEPETPRANADVSILEAMSPSDDIPSIQADLDATMLNTIESDLTAIDAELGEFEAKVSTP